MTTEAEIIDAGLRTVLDGRTVDELIAGRPDTAENVADAIGEAMLRAGVTRTRLVICSWIKLIDAGVADAHRSTPLPGFDLDAELSRRRDFARGLVVRDLV